MKITSIIWKYGNGSCNAHLDPITKNIIIDKWNLPQPEPTTAEIQQASDEYDQHLIDQPIQDQADFSAIKTKLKNKLGITTNAEWKKFRKAIRWMAENLGD